MNNLFCSKKKILKNEEGHCKNESLIEEDRHKINKLLTSQGLFQDYYVPKSPL